MRCRFALYLRDNAIIGARMQTELNISYLADHPACLETIADWVFDEWHRYRDHETPGATLERFRNHMRRDAIPLTLVALHGDEAVGTASIYIEDMLTRPDLSPWLAAVYVSRPWRRRGIGARLVTAVEHVARRLGIARLYLYTPDQERFYTLLGWQALETVVYDGARVVIMSKALRAD